MGTRYEELSDGHIEFIQQQKIFFVGTATVDSRVNVSPKGMDSFRVLNSNRVIWLNVTGSGNETSAHVQTCPRMTIMFCSFEGKPLVLRLYGTAKVIHKHEPEWENLAAQFGPKPGARQIFDLAIEMVQASCGMSIPLYSYQGERELLTDWAIGKGETGIKQYWEDKNQFSIDGLPTNILPKSH